MYDFLIVGCGLFGSVFAERATSNNKKVLIIDKRNHIGGNCYTEKTNNIDVHKYGPHIFHTNSDKIWNYITQFGFFNSFINRPKVYYNNNIYSFPINLMTLYQIWGVKTPQEAEKKLQSVRVNIENPENLEDWITSQVGTELYEIFIKGYTTKQWNTDPKNLPSSIIQRLPIRLKYDDNYFNDKYQGIPEDGYTSIIKNLIDGCDVILEADYFNNIDSYNQICKHVIYTGPIDKFFNYEFGKLDYRSLRFEEEHLHIKDFQGNAIINYTSQEIPYTRIIEHKHFNSINSDTTVISREYPQDFTGNNEPYYPINNEKNNLIYEKYKSISKTLFPKIVFGGRLAEYKYYDMHQVIGSALHLADRFFI